MDTRILMLLMIACIAGSFAQWGPDDRASPTIEDGVLTRIHRATADSKTKSEDSSPSTPASSIAPSTTVVPTTARSEPKTSSTPKSTEQTPASSTPAPTSASTSASIASRLGDTEESSTSKPKDEASPSDAASNILSRSSYPSGAPVQAPNVPDNAGGPPSIFPPPQNAFNPTPNVNGWGQAGANSWAGASAGSFAGAGSFGYPGTLGTGGANFQSRSAFANPAPSYPTNNNNGGSGYYDGNSMNQPMFFADPMAFQRMMDEHFRNLQAQFEAQQRAFWEATNSVNGVPYAMNSFPSGPSTAPGGPQSSYAGISVGPRGGFQTGYINPVAPGVESRFAEDIPPPSGNSYGVYASSVSSSSTGPDGKQVSHKKSTTVVNDNGKISSRTIED